MNVEITIGSKTVVVEAKTLRHGVRIAAAIADAGPYRIDKISGDESHVVNGRGIIAKVVKSNK